MLRKPAERRMSEGQIHIPTESNTCYMASGEKPLSLSDKYLVYIIQPKLLK